MDFAEYPGLDKQAGQPGSAEKLWVERQYRELPPFVSLIT